MHFSKPRIVSTPVPVLWRSSQDAGSWIQDKDASRYIVYFKACQVIYYAGRFYFQQMYDELTGNEKMPESKFRPVFVVIIWHVIIAPYIFDHLSTLYLCLSYYFSSNLFNFSLQLPVSSFKLQAKFELQVSSKFSTKNRKNKKSGRNENKLCFVFLSNFYLIIWYLTIIIYIITR